MDVAELLSQVTAHGAGLSSAAVGAPSRFTIDFKDKQGNMLETEAELSVEIQGPKKIEPTIDFNEDSATFTVTYLPDTSGEYSISVKLNEQGINGSPWKVLIPASGTEPSQTSAPAAEQPNPSDASAPTPTTAAPTAEDQPAADEVAVQVRGAGLREAVAGQRATVELLVAVGQRARASELLELHFDGPRAIAPPALRVGKLDGTYLLEYVAPAEGLYSLAVLWNGQHITGSPFQLNVAPPQEPAREPEPPRSSAKRSAIVYSVQGAGAKEAHAGKPARFELLAKDESTGELVPTTARLEVAFSGPRPVYAPSVVEDKTRRGVYQIQYQVVSGGQYQMSVTADGRPIEGSPFPIDVKPADKPAPSAEKPAASAASQSPPRERKQSSPEVVSASHAGSTSHHVGGLQYSVSGTGAKEAQAGKTARFEVLCKDQHGLLVPSTDRIEVSFAGPRPVYAPDVKADTNTKGVYVVQYQAMAAGSYRCTVTANGKPIDSLPPFDVQVTKEGAAAPVAPSGPKEFPKEVNLEPVALKSTGTSGGVQVLARGPGLSTAQAGKPARFELLVKDEHGLLIPLANLERITISFTGPRPVYAPSVKEDPSSRGIYAVEYQVVSAGAYQMSVQVDGKPIEGSPFELTVSGLTREPSVHQAPAAPAKDPTVIETPTLKSTAGAGLHYSAVGAGLRDVVVGRTAKFEIHVKDEHGLHQPKPAASKLDVSFTGPRPVYTPSVNESAKLPGIYSVEYQVIGAGTYHMSVQVDGRHIDGSPFEVIASKEGAATKKEEAPVAAAAVAAEPSAALKTAAGSAVTYTAKGDGLAEAVAGKPAKFEISAKDENGLLVPSRGKEKFAINFTGPRPVYAPSVKEDLVIRGVYKVEYTVVAAGTYQMHVTVDGVHITGSPFTVSVSGPTGARPAAAPGSPAPVTAATTPAASAPTVATATAAPAAASSDKSMERFKYDASGMGLLKGHAGKANRFVIVAKDKRSRPLAETELTVNVEGPDQETIAAQLEEAKNGSYAVSYKPPRPGQYKIHVLAAGGHISRSPYTVNIKGAVSAQHSSCENWFFTVRARTADGEDVDGGDDDVKVDVKGPVEVQPRVKDQGNGEYMVSLALKERGQYSITVSINGEALPNSPFQIHY